MVSLEGNLGPFRIAKDEFIDFIEQVETRLSTFETPSRELVIEISLERISERCQSLDEVTTFLGDMHLPRVVRDFRLRMSHGKCRFVLSCDPYEAAYRIEGAKNVDEARSIQDLVIEFRKKHRASPLLSAIRGLMIMMIMLFALFMLWAAPSSLSPLKGNIVAERILLVATICVLAFVAYSIWAYLTSDTPSLSFHHSILYIGKEPKNSVFLTLASTILVAIIGTLVASFILG
jgi:hypothetical protein